MLSDSADSHKANQKRLLDTNLLGGYDLFVLTPGPELIPFIYRVKLGSMLWRTKGTACLNAGLPNLIVYTQTTSFWRVFLTSLHA